MSATWVQPVYNWTQPQYYSPGYWQYVPIAYPLYPTLAIAAPGEQLKARGHRALLPRRVELQLHRFLGGQGRSGALWDISQGILAARRLTSRNSFDVVTPQFLAYPATEPQVSRMHIVCEPFKWDIKIHLPPRAPERFISIGLVLEAIHGTLHQPLEPEEWREIDTSDKRKIYQAMCSRLAESPPSIQADGRVWKIDCLLGQTMFLGLRPGTASSEAWVLSLGDQQDD